MLQIFLYSVWRIWSRNVMQNYSSSYALNEMFLKIIFELFINIKIYIYVDL
jgi:hypothetical protein